MVTIKELSLPGVYLITPTVNHDDRGFFTEIYNEKKFKELGIVAQFIQDSTSHSKKKVLRGLHYQKAPHAQDKLVRCSHGSIRDVAADVDPTSPTYGKFDIVNLAGDTQNMIFIPKEYAHGYCVVSDEATIEYKLSDTFYPELSFGVMYNDKVLGIDWKVSDPIVSKKDRNWDLLPKK